LDKYIVDQYNKFYITDNLDLVFAVAVKNRPLNYIRTSLLPVSKFLGNYNELSKYRF